MTEQIVRSGLAFGCLFTAASSLIAAAVSVPWRLMRSRGGRG